MTIAKPNIGDAGWGTTLNTALDQLDLTNPTGSNAVAANGTYPARAGGTSLVAAAVPFVNVRDYGAKGDGITDDSTAIQAAITAAGAGGHVRLPAGRYLCNSGLTLPTWCYLEGTSSQFGSGGSATTELLFTGISGATVGITAGAEARISHLVLRGPGYNVGTTTGISGATFRLSRVSILSFATGVRSTGGYYDVFTEVEWLRNGVALVLSGCYDVNLFGCRFDCTTGATFGTAITGGTVRALNLFGGSIESYSTAITLAGASQLSLTGVYFETASSGATGVAANSIDKVTVNVVGCFVYLNALNIFVRLDGSTNVALNSRGNHFVCAVSSPTTPSCYYFPQGQAVDLSGDNWSEVVKSGVVYADPSSGVTTGPGTQISWPKGSEASYGTANPVVTDGRIRVSPDKAQTLAAPGAVTFDATSQNHNVTLQANATSSTITNAVPHQDLLITWTQDATGGRTYVWPANARFAGNVAPSDTTLSTRTTVRFRYNSSVARWYEVSRAVAVPVA